MRLFVALVLGLIVGLPLKAQVLGCPYAVQFASYGVGCNTAFPSAPALSGSYNPGACTVTLTHGQVVSCCNTYAIDRLLLIGFSQASIPVPGFAGCSFLTSNELIIPLTPFSGIATASFTLPPGLSPFVVYAQAGAIYFTTIGFNYDITLSNGLQIGVQ